MGRRDPRRDLGLAQASVRGVGVAREPRAQELGVGRTGDGPVGGEGRDVRRRDPARPCTHPGDPVAGVRDDAGGEFGGHAFHRTPRPRRCLRNTRARPSHARSGTLRSGLRRGDEVAVRPMETISARQFRQAAGADGWHAGSQWGPASPTAPEISQRGVRLVAAISELAEAANHHPDVDIRYSRSEPAPVHPLGEWPHAQRRGSRAADPGRRAGARRGADTTVPQRLMIAVATPDPAPLLPFWQVATGYDAIGETELLRSDRPRTLHLAPARRQADRRPHAPGQASSCRARKCSRRRGGRGRRAGASADESHRSGVDHARGRRRPQGGHLRHAVLTRGWGAGRRALSGCAPGLGCA